LYTDAKTAAEAAWTKENTKTPTADQIKEIDTAAKKDLTEAEVKLVDAYLAKDATA
jgi:hypothetical protein